MAKVALIVGLLITSLIFPRLIAAQSPDQVGSRLATCPANPSGYWMFDDGNNTVFTDTVGGVDGVCAGDCPTGDSGQIDLAQKFDGVTTGLNIPISTTINWAADDSFSVAFWMQGTPDVTCVNKRNEVILGRDDNNSGLHWWIGCNGNTGNVTFNLLDQDGQGSSVVGPPINDGAWHHIVAMRKADTAENLLYVDGHIASRQVYTYQAGFASPTAALNVGWLNLGHGYRYTGKIDELSIHPHALTPSEIEQLVTMGQAGYGQCTAIAPQIISEATTKATVDTAYHYQVNAFANPQAQYSLLTAPPGMTIDALTGDIAWVAVQGSYSMSVAASNSLGQVEQNFDLTVLPAPQCSTDIALYWPFNETEGTLFEEMINQQNNGTCAGSCPTPIGGLVDQARTFDGQGNGIDVPPNDAINWGASDGFSIAVWMKGVAGETCTGARNEVIVGRDDTGSKLHWWLGCERKGGNAIFALIDSQNNRTVLEGPPINDGAWHHLVAVYDGQNQQNSLFVDGQLVDQAVSNYTGHFRSDTANLNFGWLNLGPGYHYQGIVDEVAVHNVALTTDQVEQQYQPGLNARGYCDATEPRIFSAPISNTDAGFVYRYQLTSEGNPTPSYSLLEAPTDMTIDSVTGLITWLAELGSHNVVAQAENSFGTTEQSFTLQVDPTPSCQTSTAAHFPLDESEGDTFSDTQLTTIAQCAGLCPTPTQAYLNLGQVFNGANTGIDIPVVDTLDWPGEDNFAVEFWARGIGNQTCSGETNEVMVGRHDLEQGLQWWVGCEAETTDILFYFQTTPQHHILLRGHPLDDNQWHHIVALHHQKTNLFALYVDGVLADSIYHTQPDGFQVTNAAINVGWLNSDNSDTFSFRGILDELAIYKVALPASAVETHYANAQNNLTFCGSLPHSNAYKVYLPSILK
ncbi:MAG: LamG domain-containing protein [Chloroflexota bacterium]